MEKFVMKLYISGQTPRSRRLMLTLHRICEEELAGKFELAVIDVLEKPHVVAEGKIFATPALVKELPLPIRRILGDLFDREKVLAALDITPGR